MLEEMLDELLSEKRIAVAALADVAHRLFRQRCTALDCAVDDGPDLIRRKRFELEAMQTARTEQLRHRREQALIPLELVRAARRDHEEPQRIHAARKITEKLERRLVRPMDVFDREHRRAFRTDSGQIRPKS